MNFLLNPIISIFFNQIKSFTQLMLNTTLLSLNIISLYSISPSFILNHNSYRKQSLIQHSHFSHFFSSVLYSKTENHYTSVKSTTFSNFVDTPLQFREETYYYEGLCQLDSQCCVSVNYYFEINKAIQELNITDSDFPEEFVDKRMYFTGRCGDIRIANCQFIRCYSEDSSGGGILVAQYCKTELHSCIFDNCLSRSHGGACAIAKEVLNDPSLDPGMESYKISKKFDCKYNCFQNCFVGNPKGFGSSMIVGAEEISIQYSSSVNDNNNFENWGAKYDLLGDYIETNHLNCSDGDSAYCSGIEYREMKFCIFKFNTLMLTKGKYVIAFNAYANDIDNFRISMCNIVHNVLLNRHDYTGSNPPGFIFYLGSSLLIDHFFFCYNECNDEATILTTLIDDIDEYPPVIMRNCYGLIQDGYDLDLPFLVLQNCSFENETLETIQLPHLDLANCQALNPVTPAPFLLTPSFSESLSFSNSLTFTESQLFTPSSIFTPTLHFDQTDYFTPSKTFTPSHFFSGTIQFSLSNFFSQSMPFKATDHFTLSNLFTFSNHFNQTANFTSSNLFTFSKHFSESNQFSSSERFTKIFSRSHIFSQTCSFSQSAAFTASKTHSASPTSSLSGQVVTNMKTLSCSFTLVKSVSMSFSHFLSKIASYTYNEEFGGYSVVLTVTEVYRSLPYLIHFYSPTSVETVFFIEVKTVKKKITSEQLIGIVCGSVGAFFGIIGIIILSQRRKMTKNYDDDFDYSISEGDEAQTNETHETKQTTKEVEVNFDIPEISKQNFDDWL